MSSPLWHKGFPEFAGSPKTLNEVLSSGELPEEKYLAWASEEYKLPLLSNDFFELAKNFNLLLDHSSYMWNESFFPVNEWNGMLYIACLEPREFNFKKNHCLVLGSLKAMKNLWGKMEQPLEASVVIDSLEFSESTLLRNMRPERSHSEEPKLVAETPTEEPVPLEISFSNLKTERSASSNPRPSPFKAPPPPPPTAEKISTGTPKAPAAPAEKFEDSFSRSDIAINPRFTATNYTLPKEFAKEIAKEVTNVAKIPGVAARKEATFTTTKTIMPFPERTSQFTFTRTIYSSQVILEAEAKIKDNNDPQKALLSAFKILQDYYKKMMWVVRDQKGYAYPIACNAEWDFTEEAWNEPMAFKHPNPFRIAKLTQKPYHGPVFASPATDKYFKLWNNGKRPDFFSVVPIMMYGKVFGYLVGCEKGPHFHKTHSLEMMEVVGKELLETFVNIHKTLSKANAA
jgi:hypothetical protein